MPNYEWATERGIITAQPEGILLIGRLSELGGDREKVESFERFRRHLWNPRVLTYDELYARAKFIVARTAQQPAETGPEDAEPPDDDWGTEDRPFG